MAKPLDFSKMEPCKKHPEYLGTLHYEGASKPTLFCPICKRAGSIDWKQIENDKKVLESLVQQGKKKPEYLLARRLEDHLVAGLVDTAQNILDCWTQWEKDGDSLAMQAADNFLHATVEAIKPRMIECGMEVPE